MFLFFFLNKDFFQGSDVGCFLRCFVKKIKFNLFLNLLKKWWKFDVCFIVSPMVGGKRNKEANDQWSATVAFEAFGNSEPLL